MAEKVLVIGAGMAGLWTALALGPTGREVVLLERDPPPPDGGPDEAFEGWTRRGVGHLRHSHAFLARLRLLIGKPPGHDVFQRAAAMALDGAAPRDDNAFKVELGRRTVLRALQRGAS